MKRFNDIERRNKRRAKDAERRRHRNSMVAYVQNSMLGAVAFIGIVLGVSPAYAQAAGGTIGAQLQTMAQEFSTAGGFTASTAMYVAALICFVGGAWYLWQSRQPENRESGKVAAGLAGLVLTGLFVTGGAWINKAAETTTGAAATVSSQAAVVTFQ